MADDFDDEENVEQHLPAGVTEPQVDALVKDVLEALDKIGLYVRHAHLAATEPDAFGQPVLMVYAVFTMGKVVFTERVQDPEQDEFDDSFRQIESDESAIAAIDIVESFRRAKDDPQS